MASGANTRRGRPILNIATRKPVVTEDDVISIAENRIFLREFNPDYDQVVKRISTHVNGLKFGAPPPPVS